LGLAPDVVGVFDDGVELVGRIAVAGGEVAVAAGQEGRTHPDSLGFREDR
jgi:hypothetical protein